MSDQSQCADDSPAETGSVRQLLLVLDLATEVLEGLDELGLESRAEVEQLMARLERQIADSS